VPTVPGSPAKIKRLSDFIGEEKEEGNLLMRNPLPEYAETRQIRDHLGVN